jgi:hypothetical protein
MGFEAAPLLYQDLEKDGVYLGPLGSKQKKLTLSC